MAFTSSNFFAGSSRKVLGCLLNQFGPFLTHWLHLGILLLLLGLLLREFLLQDQRVLHLLLQDQGSNPPGTDGEQDGMEGYLCQGEAQVCQAEG